MSALILGRGNLMVGKSPRGIALGKGGGVPDTIVQNGITYRLLYSRTTGQILTSRTTGEPLYGRAA